MHVMIDLETMGTSPNSPIVAIGACRFDENGVSEDTFYRQVSLQSSVDGGATIEAGAVIWWLKQTEEARVAISAAEGDDEWSALCDFTAWLKADELSGLWGNGAAFDNMILAQAYRRYGQEAPWQFSLDRCYRTVKNFSPVEMDRSGTHHHALDDAVSQAKHLVAIWEAAKPAPIDSATVDQIASRCIQEALHLESIDSTSGEAQHYRATESILRALSGRLKELETALQHPNEGLK